jgi:hypothetical protein
VPRILPVRIWGIARAGTREKHRCEGNPRVRKKQRRLVMTLARLRLARAALSPKHGMHLSNLDLDVLSGGGKSSFGTRPKAVETSTVSGRIQQDSQGPRAPIPPHSRPITFTDPRMMLEADTVAFVVLPHRGCSQNNNNDKKSCGSHRLTYIPPNQPWVRVCTQFINISAIIELRSTSRRRPQTSFCRI